jgi:voltage-gated potassium channel
MTKSDSKKESKLNLGYEIFVGIISILSILNIVLNIVYRYLSVDADVSGVLDIMNGLFTIIFLGDFTYRILTAPSKKDYFFRDFGWADLLASIPFDQGFLKILRVFRLYRVYRLMKNVGPKKIVNTLTKDRAGSALYVLLLMGIMVLEFGALAVLKAENVNPDANIKTAQDAVWYVIVTISTVGYGDRYPTTSWGRVVGTITILIGVGIFGTFTGFLANFFLAPQKQEEETEETPPAP